MSLKRFREQRKAQESGKVPPPPAPTKKQAPTPAQVGSKVPTKPTLFEIPFIPVNREPSPYDPSGVLLNADYEVHDQIGQGVTAYVFRCTHIKTKHEFAVKCVDKACLSHKADALQNEVFILSHVKHPNIVSLVALYEDDDMVYLIMPLMKGGELFERIIKTCPNGYTERHAARLMKSILQALEYLHRNGIVHRDLKPENLLFPTENVMGTSVMVSDFGLAKIWTKDTLLKTACGSPNYVAPEVLLKNMEGYTIAADMWSAGVIAYVLLCGFCPFHHEQTPMLLKLIIIGHYVFPSPYWDTISKEAMDFVSTLLVRDPSKRATAQQALEHPWIKRHAGTTTAAKLPAGVATSTANLPTTPPSTESSPASPNDTGEDKERIPDITETLRVFQQMQMKDGERRRKEAEDVNNFTAHVKKMRKEEASRLAESGVSAPPTAGHGGSSGTDSESEGVA